MSNTIRVALVEDHDATRKRLVRQIDSIDGFTVVSSTTSIVAAEEYLSDECPDILLVDLGLPDGDGCDLIASTSARYAELPIMVISVFGDQERVIRAIKSGAKGYMLKDDDSKSIGAAIQQLLDGGSPISPPIARHLIRQFAPEPTPVDGDVEALSAREREVLQLAAKGYTYQETADLLGITVNTVSSHTKNIYAKLAVNSRSQAVHEAARLGLVSVRAD